MNIIKIFCLVITVVIGAIIMFIGATPSNTLAYIATLLACNTIIQYCNGLNK